MADAKKCLGKHTKVQIPDEDFVCPRCGRGPEDGGVIIELSDNEDVDPKCELLHEDDEIGCYACGYGASGRAFAARYMREKSLVTCPTCKGKGVVRDPTKNSKRSSKKR